MKAHYSEYIQQILKSYSLNANAGGRVLFMKHYSSFEVNREDIERVIREDDIECKLLYHAFNVSDMNNPYEPALEWMTEYYRDKTPEELEKAMDEANVYYLHKSIIRSYIKTGICEREEDIIVSEIQYEKERFINSIINLLEYIMKDKTVIIVLHKLHFAQASTIDLLMRLIKRKSKDISILIGYNELYYIENYMTDKWNELIRYAENENLIVEYGIDDGIQHDYSAATFSIDTDDIREYCIKISNLMKMIALDEAEFYVDRVLNTLLTEQMDVAEKDKGRLLILYAYIAIYRNKTKLAFFMCKKISDLSSFSYDFRLKYKYNYLIALIKVCDRQREQAYSYVDICKEIALELNDADMIFDAEMLRYVTCFGGWNDVFVWDKNITVSESFLKDVEKRKQHNHLAYIYFFGFIGCYDSKEISDEGYIGCEKSSYFRQGMKIANSINNQQCILRAWQKQVIVASSRGEFDEITYYYNNCLDIVRRQQKRESEAQIYNGLGYNCLICERYDEADKYLKSAIDILIKTESPNYLLETLYNLALTAIAVDEFDVAITYIRIVLKMLRNLKIERMRLCNISKLYGILIVAYLKEGRMYDAKIYFDRMRRVLRHLLDTTEEPNYQYWEDDIFLYYMIEGMMYKEEKNCEKAMEAFQKARYLWTIFSNKQQYIFSHFVLEEADLYEKMGDIEKKNEILDRGIEFCEKCKYYFQEEKFKACKNGETKKWEWKEEGSFKLSDEKIAAICDITYKWGAKLELEEKSKALLFFETWVDLINKDNVSIDTMIENAMATMQNTYNLDSVLWIEVNENRTNIKYSDRNSSITKGQAKTLIEYFKKRRNKVIISRNAKSFDDNEEIVAIFGKNNICSLIGIPIIVKEKITNILIVMRLRQMNFITNSSVLNENDSNIFRTTFRQLIDAIKREMFRIKLEQSSVTDILTGLSNRQGMKKFMESQFVDEDYVSSVFTVLYIDLDNFKFCNDHFGHDIGDVVLVAFSKMLKAIVGENGSIIRYGGDEFVILLPKYEVEDGIAVANDIFDTLKKNMGFKHEIEKAYKNDISIEKKNRISCSIGIASGNCKNEQEMIDILKKADEALYKVKKTTKHDFEVWSENMD